MAAVGGGDFGRWCLRCSDAGETCSLSMGGLYEEVLDEGVAHWRRAHGAHGDEAEVREAVAEMMRRQDTESLWPPEMGGDGRRAAGEPDWPFG